MSHVRRTSFVDAPFSSAIDYVSDFFSEHRYLRVKAVASTTTVETRYELVDDRTDDARRHDAVAFSWRPHFSVFPRFKGTVTVRPHSGGSKLELEGTYDPPGGILGRLFDACIGKRLARGTLDHLLGKLQLWVENRHRQYQASRPTIEDLNELSRVAGQARR